MGRAAPCTLEASPERRNGFADSHEVVCRQSFEPETVAVDQDNRHQAEWGRN